MPSVWYGKKMNLFGTGFIGGEIDNRTDRVAIGVKFRDQWYAHNSLGTALGQPTKIVHHSFGGAAGPLFEAPFIDVFQIRQHQVKPGQ
ncbi:Uncharacterised protein [Serratia quinivorans]|uniref:Uncharacterized protein n=1 Tax=Serratia quinivorans TaxID=137545 RepID=A0A380ATU3_9GAMM|nr:Uncharacterised protein [Serratia quinivorans]